MDNFHNRLELLIKENKTKKKVLAEAIGLSAQAITEMTKGRSNASLQTIRSIAKHYKVSEEWLEYGTGEKHPQFEVTTIYKPDQPKMKEALRRLNEEGDEELADMVLKLLNMKKG